MEVLSEETKIEFLKNIKNIQVSKIKPNPLNPRKKSSEMSDDQLLESISQKGILTPLIMYKNDDDMYTLVEGERRLNAAKKLGLEEVPAHVITRPLTKLENLTIMFQLHNVREDWYDVDTAIALRDLAKLLGTDNTEDLAEYTALPVSKVRKYKRILQFDDNVLDRFRALQEKGKEESLDSDILVELNQPIRNFKRYCPDLLDTFPENKIVDIVVKKKLDGELINNAELRFLTKTAKSIGKGAEKSKVISAISDYFEKNISPEEVFERASEQFYNIDKVKGKCDNLTDDIKEINKKHVPEAKKKGLRNSILELKAELEKILKNLES